MGARTLLGSMPSRSSSKPLRRARVALSSSVSLLPAMPPTGVAIGSDDEGVEGRPWTRADRPARPDDELVDGERGG